MTAPVTVSITRHVDPAQEDQMLAWLRPGAELAERFDGFLDSGWVRPAVGSSEWHVLYRFADHQALEAWMTSGQRRKGWFWGHLPLAGDSAQGFVDESQLEQRTGIEGWFDEPSGVDVQDLRPAPAAPPRWKHMVSTFLAFLPLSLLVTYLGQEFLADVWMPLRVLVSVLVMTPVMIYAALPWITRLLHGWLHA